MAKTPTKVNFLLCETTCVGITFNKWENLMKGHTRSNKKQIDRLVKKHLPKLYEELRLNFYNPYNYYKTKRHLILVHSGIEYFISYG